MAYIEPSTVIRICNNVPMDSSYRHTILFENESAQISYFTSKAKFPLLQRVSYQRVSKGKLRVQIKADDLYDCNYMCFQNANFGTKWFYAFINNVEYINNETSEITYVIDELQTWLFEMTLKTCYIEREHVSDDRRGVHTIPENLEIGEYLITSTHEKTYGRAILTQVLTDGENQGTLVNGVYTGTYSSIYEENNIGALNDWLHTWATTAPERVINVQMCADCMGSNGDLQEFDETYQFSRDLIFQETNTNYPPDNPNTYIPSNNKLYCYPYMFFTCDNYSGNSEEYHYEDFYNDVLISMKIHATPSPLPVLSCSPFNYKTSRLSHPTEDKFSNQYAVQYTDFPKCSWKNDSYQTWASRVIPKALLHTGTQVVSQVMHNAIGLANASFIGGVAPHIAQNMNVLNNTNNSMGIVERVGDLAIEAKWQKTHSLSMGGELASGFNFALGNIGFRFTCFAIRPEIAKTIDDFFTKFGYKVDVNKVPNIKSRKYFNYIKTYDCLITGNIPNNSKTFIEQIFNKGITFWHTTDVGNYDVNNSIV